MTVEEAYKGYRLRIKRTSECSIMIWPPNSGLALETIVFSTLEEGLDVARERAYEIIEAEISAL